MLNVPEDISCVCNYQSMLKLCKMLPRKLESIAQTGIKRASKCTILNVVKKPYQWREDINEYCVLPITFNCVTLVFVHVDILPVFLLKMLC